MIYEVLEISVGVFDQEIKQRGRMKGRTPATVSHPSIKNDSFLSVFEAFPWED